MAYDAPTTAGTAAQRKEYYLRRILEVFPERKSDPKLIYGNAELEYLRLSNDGLIPPDPVELTPELVEANLPARLSAEGITQEIKNEVSTIVIDGGIP